MADAKGLERQLRRQADWLGNSWKYLIKMHLGDRAVRPSALDVGCGPGFVIETLAACLDAQGVDRDPDMVRAGVARGLRVSVADAKHLPFADASFDVAYCSFLLLWSPEPLTILSEMKRVAREWVVCLAEPDFGGRIDYPDDLAVLRDMVIASVREDGGDPFVGRKLRELFGQGGIEAEVGIHPGLWGLDRLAMESADEWRWLEMTVGSEKLGRLNQLKPRWEEALRAGSLFQLNPIFYAFGRKR
jgi:SAM-dependent methyltransferase